MYGMLSYCYVSDVTVTVMYRILKLLLCIRCCSYCYVSDVKVTVMYRMLKLLLCIGC